MLLETLRCGSPRNLLGKKKELSKRDVGICSPCVNPPFLYFIPRDALTECQKSNCFPKSFRWVPSARSTGQARNVRYVTCEGKKKLKKKKENKKRRRE